MDFEGGEPKTKNQEQRVSACSLFAGYPLGVGTRFLEEVEFLRARDRLGAVVKHQQDMFSVQIDFQAGNQRLR